MSKLEIGTKIKIREDLKENSDRSPYVDGSMLQYRGQIATITNYGSVGYRIDLDEQRWYWVDWMFEVVEDIEVIQNFTKNDLKVGMLVEFKIDNNHEIRAVVMPQEKDIYGNTMYLIINDGGYYNVGLENFNDDLSGYYFRSRLNRIYGSPKGMDIDRGVNLFDTDNRELLWSKKREMTVKEIEELLGYEIKIVA